jgi:hypothetical protein
LFVQSASANTVKVATSDIIFSFTQTSDGNLVASGSSGIEFVFSQDITPTLIKTSVAELVTSFTQTTIPNLIASGESSMTFLFVMTVDGGLLWVPIDPGGTPNWSAITHTGDSWTEINAGGTINQWTEEVV